MMIPARISPSLMCADLYFLPETLQTFQDNGIEALHIDIMDGSFVPNYTLGPDYCHQLRQHTAIPLDLHLMVDHPEEKIDWFPIAPGDQVAVHCESTCHLQRTLAQIRGKGARAVAALNPATPLDSIRYVLDDLDGILIMSVNPGFAGQKLIPSMLHKIRDTRSWLNTVGYPQLPIEVDGNVSPDNAARMRAAGADTFVAGTASIFRDGQVTADRIRTLRNAIRQGETN